MIGHRRPSAVLNLATPVFDIAIIDIPPHAGDLNQTVLNRRCVFRTMKPRHAPGNRKPWRFNQGGCRAETSDDKLKLVLQLGAAPGSRSETARAGEPGRKPCVKISNPAPDGGQAKFAAGDHATAGPTAPKNDPRREIATTGHGLSKASPRCRPPRITSKDHHMVAKYKETCPAPHRTGPRAPGPPPSQLMPPAQHVALVQGERKPARESRAQTPAQTRQNGDKDVKRPAPPKPPSGRYQDGKSTPPLLDKPQPLATESGQGATNFGPRSSLRVEHAERAGMVLNREDRPDPQRGRHVRRGDGPRARWSRRWNGTPTSTDILVNGPNRVFVGTRRRAQA